MVAARAVGTGLRCRVGSALATSLVRVLFPSRSKLLRVQCVVSVAALPADAGARLRGGRPNLAEAGHICRVGSALVASCCQCALRLVSTASFSVVVGVVRYLTAEMMAGLRWWRLNFFKTGHICRVGSTIVPGLVGMLLTVWKRWGRQLLEHQGCNLTPRCFSFV